MVVVRSLRAVALALLVALALGACALGRDTASDAGDGTVEADAADLAEPTGAADDGPIRSEAPIAESATAPIAPGDRAVAEQFIDVLRQLPGFAPIDTTLTFEQRALRSDSFLAALEGAARSRGFGIRTTAAVGVANAVSHLVDPADGGDEVVRIVSVGDAQMRRRYARLADGAWTPAGSLFVRGADASGVRLAQIATALAPRATTRLAAASPAASPTDDIGVADAPRVPDAPNASVATVERSGVSAVRGDQASDRAVLPTPRNVAELGASNYQGLFENYGNLEEIVLVFPNDSMLLGDGNKRRIRELLKRVDPERDLFSIVGCSFGKTRIANGNEVLATGRANRVKEELIFAGVSGERVLDEGCWAGSPDLQFPTRGVVLTVKRPLG